MGFNSGVFNSGLDIGKSYYVATANPAPDHPALQGDIDADLVVVGGGCTGLSAALHAAERGLKVVLLEGGKVGWGASGRNGGQIIPGLRKGAKGLVKVFGRERARALFDLALEARGLVLDLIECHAIDCDLRLTGHLAGAVNGSDLRDLEEEVECLASVMNFHDVEVLSAEQARAMVNTPYHGAMYEKLGGHMHPLNYTLGLARAAAAAGVTIHEFGGAAAGAGTCCPGFDGQGLGPGQACRAGGRCAAPGARAARQQPHHAGRQLHRRDRAAG